MIDWKQKNRGLVLIKKIPPPDPPGCEQIPLAPPGCAWICAEPILRGRTKALCPEIPYPAGCLWGAQGHATPLSPIDPDRDPRSGRGACQTPPLSPSSLVPSRPAVGNDPNGCPVLSHWNAMVRDAPGAPRASPPLSSYHRTWGKFSQ